MLNSHLPAKKWAYCRPEEWEECIYGHGAGELLSERGINVSIAHVLSNRGVREQIANRTTRHADERGATESHEKPENEVYG